jgi:hypothetical protein
VARPPPPSRRGLSRGPTHLLQFKARRSGSWTNVAIVSGSEPDGFFTTTVQLPSAGGLRISWSGLGNIVYDSRIATVN